MISVNGTVSGLRVVVIIVLFGFVCFKQSTNLIEFLL